MSKKPPPKLSRGLSMAQFMSAVDTTQLDKIKELWDQLDTNKKGVLSAEDLLDVMQSVNVDASEEEVNELIKELDSDGDGKISFKDFAKGALKKQSGQQPNGSQSPTLSPSSRTSSPSPNTSRTNSPTPRGTSPIPPSVSSGSPPGKASPIPSKLHSQFTQPTPRSPKVEAAASSPRLENKEREKDKVNEIANEPKPPGSPVPKFIRSPSVVQFVQHLTGPQLSEMQTLFNHYDHDKDGRIDRKSVGSIVKEINPTIGAADIQELINAIDSDRDGQVNFKEFIDGIVMVYRTNKRHAEKVVQETKQIEEKPKVSKKELKKTIAKLQDDVTVKDITIEQLRKQISELQQENTKLKKGSKV